MTDEACPTCGKPMADQARTFGKFIACSGYRRLQDDQSPWTIGISVPPQEGCGGQLVAA